MGTVDLVVVVVLVLACLPRGPRQSAPGQKLTKRIRAFLTENAADSDSLW